MRPLGHGATGVGVAWLGWHEQGGVDGNGLLGRGRTGREVALKHPPHLQERLRAGLRARRGAAESVQLVGRVREPRVRFRLPDQGHPAGGRAAHVSGAALPEIDGRGCRARCEWTSSERLALSDLPSAFCSQAVLAATGQERQAPRPDWMVAWPGGHLHRQPRHGVHAAPLALPRRLLGRGDGRLVGCCLSFDS